MKVITIIFLLFSSIFFSACNSKPAPIVPTPTPRLVELKPEERPQVSLIPRTDGRELKLKIENISSLISQIDYELTYVAVDKGLEIEKGLGDTIKVNSTSLERNLLLGTASCTNGCKYKYDEGIKGGNITLTLTTTGNQISTLNSAFTLSKSKNKFVVSMKSFQDDSDITFTSQ